jgi:sulfane dehydrogenase subunit SoxC
MAEEGHTAPDGVTLEELQLATRNHGLPLEALRYDVTPVGLHYLLIHYDIPFVDAAAWRLAVSGQVRRALSLSLEDLRALPQHTVTVTMECAGNGRARMKPRAISQPWLSEAVGTARWTGVPLQTVLEAAGIEGDAVAVSFTGLDAGVEDGVSQRYARGLSLAESLLPDVLLAHGVNDMPLPPQHGFPLRLIVPGWYGMTSVKWLSDVTVLRAPFDGFQQHSAYRLVKFEGDAGDPLTRMLPRSLMLPPGIPEFMSRTRLLAPGVHLLQGRAWSGWGRIEQVQVSTDAGSTWHEAELRRAQSEHAWQSWSYPWQCRAGRHELCSRARDACGYTQPLQPSWNLHGYANNAVQRIDVLVADES